LLAFVLLKALSDLFVKRLLLSSSSNLVVTRLYPGITSKHKDHQQKPSNKDIPFDTLPLKTGKLCVLMREDTFAAFSLSTRDCDTCANLLDLSFSSNPSTSERLSVEGGLEKALTTEFLMFPSVCERDSMNKYKIKKCYCYDSKSSLDLCFVACHDCLLLYLLAFSHVLLRMLVVLCVGGASSSRVCCTKREISTNLARVTRETFVICNRGIHK
jgi:hypothetical protein